MPARFAVPAGFAAVLLQLLSVATLQPAAAAQPRHFDILIRGGQVIDGSGEPRYQADVGIDGDEIVAIGRFPDATAKRSIEAGGRVVTPGFIDMHSHAADGGDHGKDSLHSQDPKRRAAQNFVAQGITTGLANPDGNQRGPLRSQREQMERDGIGMNVILMTGHSGLRRDVMKGDVARPATPAEILLMQEQLTRDLEQAESFGMSLGVEYDGARFSSAEEQIALGRVLAAHNGVFSPHLRSQGISPMWYRPSQHKDIKPPTLEDSIDETLRVAETGAVVVFTHMKAWGPGYRGEAKRIVQRLQAARERGARIYMDVYPYDSSGSDGSFTAMPSWIFGEPPPSAAKRFDYKAAFEKAWKKADAGKRDDFALDVRHQIALKGGVENVRVLEYPKADYVGKTLAELMQQRKLDEVELVIALQREGDASQSGGARMRSFSMDENDIATFYRLDWCAVSTDGWVVLPEEAVGDKKYTSTNRRLFGSIPQRLAYYSQQLDVDTLEHAVRSGTALPAQILNLRDRGRLAPGMKADVVVLDMERLKDNTTYLEPSVYPSGVDYVLVNGQFAIDSGKRTLALNGRVLRPEGQRPAASGAALSNRSNQ